MEGAIKIPQGVPEFKTLKQVLAVWPEEVVVEIINRWVETRRQQKVAKARQYQRYKALEKWAEATKTAEAAKAAEATKS